MRFIELFLFIFLLVICLDVKAQKPVWWQKDSTFKIKPFMMVQLWGVNSMNMMADIDGDGDVESVQNRFNPQLRRARMGFRANPYPGLKFTLVAYYDGIGRDALDASMGPANNPHGTEFGIWDAFFQYKILKNSEALNFTGGFFRPQFGRESITSGFATTSGEKAMQQGYIRRHLVGTGPGRAIGLNIGGILENNSAVSLNYNLGYFTPNNTSHLQNTVGAEFAALWVGRAVLNFGDPEMEKYRIGYQTNYYNKRKGLSIGLNSSYQAETDIFTQSTANGIDFLFNWGKINIDGEWIIMNRQNDTTSYTSRAGHIRAGYNIMVGGKILEPVVMYNFFDGATDEEGQMRAQTFNNFSGTDNALNMGFNFYLSEHKLKLIAHYVVQNGSAGRNSFNRQSALGEPIERGDYIVVGLNAVF